MRRRRFPFRPCRSINWCPSAQLLRQPVSGRDEDNARDIPAVGDLGGSILGQQSGRRFRPILAGGRVSRQPEIEREQAAAQITKHAVALGAFITFGHSVEPGCAVAHESVEVKSSLIIGTHPEAGQGDDRARGRSTDERAGDRLTLQVEHSTHRPAPAGNGYLEVGDGLSDISKSTRWRSRPGATTNDSW